MMVMMKGKDGDVGQNGSPVCCPRNLFIDFYFTQFSERVAC